VGTGSWRVGMICIVPPQIFTQLFDMLPYSGIMVIWKRSGFIWDIGMGFLFILSRG
jgi:hypothetical protein